MTSMKIVHLYLCLSTFEILPPPSPWTSYFKQTPLSKSYSACERTKSEQEQNQVMSNVNLLRVLLFDLTHKKCNGIIKGWLHCLVLESKGRFLVNNILMFGST